MAPSIPLRSGLRPCALGLAAALTLSACTGGQDPTTSTGAATSEAAGSTAGSTAAPAPTTDDTATTETAPTTADAVARTTAAPSATAAPRATGEPDEDPLPDGAVTALILGTDSRTPGAMDGNADTIMLAQISEDREELALVSITRDSWVAIPGLGHGKINSAFSRGGTEVMRQTVSQLFGGLEIDYVAQTDFEGFIGMTRALDGFTVDNQHYSSVTVNATGRFVEFTEGATELENTDGLIYVRERKALPLGDLDRTERQRAAIVGMLGRLAELEGAELHEAMGHIVSRTKITGDLDVKDALVLAKMSRDLDTTQIISLMAPITGFGMQGGASVNVVDEAQTAALGEALRSGDVTGYVEAYGTGYAP